MRALPVVFCAALFCGAACAADVQPQVCAKTSLPARMGARIQNQLQLIGFTLTAVTVVMGEPDKSGALTIPAPQWCLDRDVTVAGRQYVLWHNSAADAPNASGPFDRITAPGNDPNTAVGAITSIADRLAPSTKQPGDPEPPVVVYHIVLETADKIEILASYDAPPSPDDLGHFATARALSINAVIDKKSRKVQMYAPQ
jgi:hypothetical protein